MGKITEYLLQSKRLGFIPAAVPFPVYPMPFADDNLSAAADAMPGEIDIGALLRAIWRRRILVVITAACFLVLGSLYLHVAQRLYTVTLKITPVQTDQQQSGSSSLSGLASLAGISLPSNRGQQSFAIYLDGLTTRLASEMLFRDQPLMHRVFAREWDAQNHQWRPRSSMIHGAVNAVRWVLGIPTTKVQPPSPARLQTYIQQNLTTEKEKESPIVTITMTAASPELGRDLLTGLHRTVDDILRQRALERSTNYINYLTTTLQTTTVAEYRQTLVDSLSSQAKNRMIASANLPFVAEPFGQPVTSDVPTSPSATIVLGLMFMLGLCVGCGVALFQDWREKDRY
jgi:LPS O-antigen subunit length determinant protein (WzzB/FepE family)